LPARHPWRDAAEPYRARRADALIDISKRLQMTGLIFNFLWLRILATTAVGAKLPPLITG
jgi:hypothetical protein